MQPAITAYPDEFTPLYRSALGRIRDAVTTLDMHERARLTRHRNGAIANLAGNRGRSSGMVPLFRNKKELGAAWASTARSSSDRLDGVTPLGPELPR